MKCKATISIIIICALTGTLLYSATAQGPTVLGVKAGDNFTYTFEVLWSSSDPNDIPPQEFSAMNQTVTIHVNVTDVGTSIAYVNIVKTMRDGSQTSAPGFVEVLSGRGVEAQILIIAANLTAGEKAYPDSAGPPAAVESFTIDETVTRTYLGTSKTVNHYTERVVNSTTGNYIDRNAYYEQETGVLMEMTITHYFADVDETDSEHWKIFQFNSASVPSDGNGDGANGGDSAFDWSPLIVPLAVVSLVIVVIALLAVVLIMRRRKAVSIDSQPEQPQNTQ